MNLTTLKIKSPTNVIYNKNTNTIQLDSLTLKQNVEQAVKKGIIDEARIDSSVKRILKAKGIKIA